MIIKTRSLLSIGKEKMQCKPTIIKYCPELECMIRNQSSLTPGTGAKYLLCLVGEERDNIVYIAKSWHRKMPIVDHGYILISF
jgi:hypothetical protein